MKLASIPPVACSGCFQQNTDRIHVDLDAAYDGPILDADGAKHSIDDIIICEDCVRAAVALLPESRVLQEQYDELAAQYARVVDYLALVQDGISKFEDALRIQLDPIRASAPRKRPAGTGGAVKVKV